MLDINPQRGTVYFQDLKIGMAVQTSTLISQSNIDAFAAASTDYNPIHLDEDYAKTSIFETRIAHGAHTASLISAAIGEYLPGHGSIYLGQSLKFVAPVRADDTVVVNVEIKTINTKNRHITLDCNVSVKGETVLTGEATVLAPKRSE